MASKSTIAEHYKKYYRESGYAEIIVDFDDTLPCIVNRRDLHIVIVCNSKTKTYFIKSK